MCVQGPTNRLLPNPNGFLLDSYGNLMVFLWVPISFIWVLRCWSVLSCVRLRKKDLLLLWVNVCDVFLCMCGCVCHCVCSCVVVCVCVSMWAGLHMAFETSALFSSSPSLHHHHIHIKVLFIIITVTSSSPALHGSA